MWMNFTREGHEHRGSPTQIGGHDPALRLFLLFGGHKTALKQEAAA